MPSQGLSADVAEHDCLAWLRARGFLQSKERLLHRGSPYTAAPLLYDFLLSTAHLLEGPKVINWHKLHKAEGLVPLSNVSVGHLRRLWLNTGLISTHKFWISAWRTPAQEGNLKPPLYQAAQIQGLSNWRDYWCSLCFCCNCWQKLDRSRMGTGQRESVQHTSSSLAKHLCCKNKENVNTDSAKNYRELCVCFLKIIISNDPTYNIPLKRKMHWYYKRYFYPGDFIFPNF